MQKKGPERGRSWIGSNPLILLLLLLLLPLLWLYRGDSASTTLGYGEFKQVLQAPGVRFREVKVGRTEVRGKLLLNDHISGADAKKESEPSADREKAITFRTPRQGMELD